MANQQIPSDELTRLTDRHCAPVLAGSMRDIWIKGSSDPDHSWATMTFVTGAGGRTFGVTCNHVVQYAEATGSPAFMLALGRHTPLTGLVARSESRDPDFPFDIAVFELDLEHLEHEGKVPLALKDAPSLLQEGELALAVGFPGKVRSFADEFRMNHPLCYVSATCRAVSDRCIRLNEHVPDQRPNFSVGGMSGGPILRIDSPQTYSLAGIISEGRGRVDAEDGQIAESLWVSGFPFGATLLRELLERRGVACNPAMHRTTRLAPSRR